VPPQATTESVEDATKKSLDSIKDLGKAANPSFELPEVPAPRGRGDKSIEEMKADMLSRLHKSVLPIEEAKNALPVPNVPHGGEEAVRKAYSLGLRRGPMDREAESIVGGGRGILKAEGDWFGRYTKGLYPTWEDKYRAEGLPPSIDPGNTNWTTPQWLPFWDTIKSVGGGGAYQDIPNMDPTTKNLLPQSEGQESNWIQGRGGEIIWVHELDAKPSGPVPPLPLPSVPAPNK
tara:strand:+ start:477 stop:1175 length:699 start_codon:yes stop_codon:yes gene_type:complete